MIQQRQHPGIHVLMKRYLLSSHKRHLTVFDKYRKRQDLQLKPPTIGLSLVGGGCGVGWGLERRIGEIYEGKGKTVRSGGPSVSTLTGVVGGRPGDA